MVGGKHLRAARFISQNWSVAVLCFVGIQLTLLVEWALESEGRTRTTTAAGAFAVIDAFLIVSLSLYEHTHSIRPSIVLEVYLFFTLLFDIVRARTLWLIDADHTATVMFTSSVALKAVVLGLEAHQKRGSWIQPEDNLRSREETNGAFGQASFSWLIHLINTGYKSALSMPDLYPLAQDMRSEDIGARFDVRWMQTPQKTTKDLAFSLFHSLRWHALTPAVPRLAMIGFTYCQPLLISRVLNYQKQPETSDSNNIGYGLIAAYGIVYIGLAFATAGYWFRVHRVTTMIRGVIAARVFDKVNERSITNVDDSAAITLMSSDVERIMMGLNVCHETWANLIEAVIGIYLLEQQISHSALISLGVALVCAVTAGSLASTAGSRQKAWMEAIERRISATANMLSSMKSVKMLGLSQPLSSIIRNLRKEEIKSATRFRALQITMFTLAYVPQTLSPVFTFTAYTLLSKNNDSPTLDVSRLFTSLSILLLLANQFTQLFQSIPSLVSAFACLGRVRLFMTSENRIDKRRGYSHLPPISKSSVSLASMVSDLLEHPPLPSVHEKSNSLSTMNSTVNSVEPPPYPTSCDTIVFRKASFSWNDLSTPALADLNLKIKSNQLTMIVGPVASGKSTMLKAILGELKATDGTVAVSSKEIAYCDQTPWLRNATIQENIVGFAPYDQTWYYAVVRDCSLEPDLLQLPNGDQTLVGSSGITLSGGQKERVAIARAIYARKSIALFDDVMSGMDATTARAVFESCFSKQGLLRRSQTTVVLATHAAHFLPSADHIIVLNSSGQVAEQGTYEELSWRKGSYLQKLSIIRGNTSTGTVNEIRSTGSMGSMSSSTFVADNKKEKAPPVGSECVAPPPGRQLGDKRVYLHYFKATGLVNAILFVVYEVAFVTLEYFPTLWLSWWSESNDRDDNTDIGYYLGIYSAFQVGFLLALFLGARHVANVMVVASGKQLHEQLLHAVIKAPMAFFSVTDTGITLNRFSQDLQLIDAELPIALLLFGANALGAVALAILVLVASHYVGLAFVLVIIVLWLVQRYYLRTSRQLRFLDLEAKSPLYSLFLEALKGRATIRAFHGQDKIKQEYINALDASQRPLYLLYSVQQWLTLVLGLVAAAVAVILVALMVQLRSSTTSAGLGGVALVNMIQLSSTLMSVVIVWTKLETSIGAVARVHQFSTETPKEPEPVESTPPPEDWPARGAVEFKNVTATYKLDSPSALQNVTLSIAPGEKIGICGRSGSGKSSLVSTLFRLLDPNSGSITIDNLDLSTLQPDLVRERLTCLPQEPYFAPGTIRFNADPFNTCTDEQINSTLSELNIWDAIMSHTDGLSSPMEPEILSHGQRQLFCLARALLRSPRRGVVVLDEATSSVDAETDGLMQRVIRTKFKTQTLIVVAHRLHTILDFDKVAVFDKGVLVEFANPVELLAQGGTVFSELYGDGSGSGG
ncbi:ABC multidrug transporter [Amylocarpus encephaloides]|uniref:ABC multidrug transporter n=1 Tax=Amylocarpus encephaloides TaxID=45428 RepID=A0A9P8C989_9HELO|nr:ABC multidrug transporter [Amylocarpus encephaloides]